MQQQHIASRALDQRAYGGSAVLADEQVWKVDDWRNPVINWMYSRLVDGALSPGRFYYSPTLDREGVTVAQVPAFLNVANRLFRWSRKNTVWVDTEWGRERLGAEAAKRLERGEYELRMNPW